VFTKGCGIHARAVGSDTSHSVRPVQPVKIRIKLGTQGYPAVSTPVPVTHLKPISALTRVCAVFGHPIRHSASPALQHAGITALGLDWRYLAFDVAPDRLEAAVTGAKAMRFVGLNLTVPHKEAAIGFVDVLDESARAWGAVNTIVFEAPDADGRWIPIGQLPDQDIPIVRVHGYNTDADALSRSIEEDLGLRLSGARVFLLGTGGAGRTAALRLASGGVGALYLYNRTRSKAAVVADEIRQRHPAVHVEVAEPESPVDLVVNATSLGLRPDDPLPLDTGRWPLSRAGAVYDMIYRPTETPLLRHARAAGCRTANGLGMLLYQGARALELWSGKAAPLALMRRALEAEVARA